jgi:hypothetical protein
MNGKTVANQADPESGPVIAREAKQFPGPQPGDCFASRAMTEAAGQ